jgi:hypothetical protein
MCLASILWFSELGFGARSADSLMSRPVTWRILDTGIGFVMLLIAWNLLQTDLTQRLTPRPSGLMGGESVSAGGVGAIGSVSQRTGHWVPRAG